MLALLLSSALYSAEEDFADPSYDRLIKDYKRAHSTQNSQQIKSSICWDRVTEGMQKIFLKHIKKGFFKKVDKIYFDQLNPKIPLEYTRKGITYRPSLKALAQLVIIFEKDGVKTKTKFLVGDKNGRKLIVTAAPVKK